MSETIKILVVDDEPDVEALITQKFRKEIRKGNMVFVFAHDGQHALEVLEKEPEVLMVLSDINMPRMDGLTLLTHLEEHHNELKTVVVSAYGDMENIRTAMNRGAFDFVTKPIQFSDLETTIKKTLSHLEGFKELQRQRSEAKLAQKTLSRFFSPSVAQAILTNDNQLMPSGEKRTATFLFTDLAGFTKLVEATEPKVTVELLNDYIEGIANIIFRHNGTVMKVIGDAINGVFGAPLDLPDHAGVAVVCALEIDDFAEKFREEWKTRGVALGVTRIGINTGEAIIGNFGGKSFFDYTAYGDSVNVAARLEAANKLLGTRLCVSDTVRKTALEFHGRPSGKLMLNGKTECITCFEPQSQHIANSSNMNAYCTAFAKLSNGEADARQAFAALIATLPDDPLTLLHLQRALGGATDTVVDATGSK